MTDLNTMLRQQMQNTLTAQLDAATQAGDIAAARKAAQSLMEFSVATAAATTKPAKKPPTIEELKKAIMAKADWFGVDPRRSAKAVELGKMMDPERFETADAFADALLKELAKDEKPPRNSDSENNADDDSIDENDDDDSEDEDAMDAQRQGRNRPARRNGTTQPELNAGGRSNGGTNLRRAFDTGDIKHLPRAAADEIRKSADKFARNGDEKQRKIFIENAVKARARSDLIATGKFNARDNKFK